MRLAPDHGKLEAQRATELKPCRFQTVTEIGLVEFGTNGEVVGDRKLRTNAPEETTSCSFTVQCRLARRRIDEFFLRLHPVITGTAIHEYVS